MTAPTLPARPVGVRAPAKVNLSLRVGGRRPDGYHELTTVFMAVGLHDEVWLTEADEWSVTCAGPCAAGVPLDESNLALRAARLVSDVAGGSPAYNVHVHKDIPVAGGMAGGSADAAAALVAADAALGAGLSREMLHELAGRLGSDVPFPLTGGIAVGSGRGEQLVPALARGQFHWVFAVSDAGLSTPAVFAELDRLHPELVDSDVTPAEPSTELMAALRSGDAALLGAALDNDLAEAAFSLRPDLRAVSEAGLEHGALGAVVSGSGPTVAFLTDSAEGALDLCVSLSAGGIANEVKRARGPVHGAALILGPPAR